MTGGDSCRRCGHNWRSWAHQVKLGGSYRVMCKERRYIFSDCVNGTFSWIPGDFLWVKRRFFTAFPVQNLPKKSHGPSAKSDHVPWRNRTIDFVRLALNIRPSQIVFVPIFSKTTDWWYQEPQLFWAHGWSLQGPSQLLRVKRRQRWRPKPSRSLPVNVYWRWCLPNHLRWS